MNNQATVLIVDDEKHIRNALSEILTFKGYNTLEAEDGQSALRTINSQKVDVVLLDLLMPDINGMEVLEKAKQINPNLPVIMITAYGTISSAVEAIKKGAYDFIEKPLDAEKVLIALKNAMDRCQLVNEVFRLRRNILDRYKMVGRSRLTQAVFQQIDRLAPLDCTVLITGDTGTGKDLVARSLHNLSPRISKPFVKVNCAALPQELIESELFGYVKGAFTGAFQDKPGKFEAADGGTLFLDEIAEMPLSAQAKLLQVLDEKKFSRVGEVRERKVDVRIISATNKDLKKLSEQGAFRSDLFYRLSIAHIHLSPLKDRPEDIMELVEYYLPVLCEDMGLPVKRIAAEALWPFMEYEWPGNVRELKHKLQEMIIYHQGELLEEEYVRKWLTPAAQFAPGEGETGGRLSLRQARENFERDFIYKALIANNWNIPATAKYLGMERTNLYRRMKGLGITRRQNQQKRRETR